VSENEQESGIASRARQLAADLNLMAGELADSDQAERNRRLTSALSRALRKEPEADRGRLLSEIEQRCEPARGLPVEGVDPMDPWLLVGRLRAAAASIPEAERREIAASLAASGIAPESRGAAIGPEGEARLREALGLGSGDELSGDRAADLAAMLAGPVVALETLAWRTWKSMAPESDIRRRGELQPGLAGYCSGSSSTPVREQLVEDLARFRQLLASLLASLSRAGDVVSGRLASLDPQQIHRFSEPEKKWNESIEAACWRKYQQLYKEMDPSNIDGELRRAFAEYAGGLLGAR